jgi:hypothetical protein
MAAGEQVFLCGEFASSSLAPDVLVEHPTRQIAASRPIKLAVSQQTAR